MYKLIRRISSTFFPRPDRPWNDDATSNAPQIGKKRRMSDDEDVPEPSSIKRHRTGLAAEDTVVLEEASLPTPEQEGNADGVKEVTKGVREVELEDHAKEDAEEVEPVATETAAAVPLPDSPVLEAQTETSDVVVSEAPAEPEKEEMPRKPEEDSAEPAAPAAEETEITEDVVPTTAGEVTTVEDATSTQPKDTDTTTHTTSDEVISEEKRTEVVAEAA